MIRMKSRGYAEVSEDLHLSFLRDFLKCGKITSSMGDDAINGSGYLIIFGSHTISFAWQIIKYPEPHGRFPKRIKIKA